MTTFLLSRHGRTAWNAQGRYAGVTDLELDAEGLAQAARLGEWARTAGLTAVVSSPMKRAVRTASPASEVLRTASPASVALRTDDRLREVDFGIAEGSRRDELDPEVVRLFQADPVAHPYPGAEDPRAAASRFASCLADLDDGGRVLVVAHNTLLRLGLCALLGIPLRDYRRRLPVFEHSSLTAVSFGREGAALLSYNVPLVPCDRPGGGVADGDAS